MKVLNKFLVLFSCVTFLSTTAFAGNWIKEGNFYKYQDDDGTFVTSSWRMIPREDGIKYKYYFDEHGHMANTITKIKDDYYFFSDTGELAANAKITIDEKERKTDKDGNIGGLPFGLESQTDFTGEWVQAGDDWKYMQNGQVVTNKFVLIRSGNSSFNVYYFDNLGNMARGINYINGKYYFFNQDGSAKSYDNIYVNGMSNPTQGLGRFKDDINISDADIAAYNLELRSAELDRLARLEAKKNAAKVPETTAAFVPPQVDLTTYTIASKNLNSFVFKNDEGGKLTVTYYVPVLQGPNADLVNNAIANNYGRIVKHHFEDYLDDYTTTKTTMKLNELSLYHDKTENTIRITLYGDSSMSIYINANNGDIYQAY